MSDNGQDDPPEEKAPREEPVGEVPKGVNSDRARQLFGHKSGASPWEKPASAVPGQEKSVPTGMESLGTASAPYPRDAQYTPRSANDFPTEQEKSAVTDFDIFADEIDDEGELKKLHPNYKLMMRVGAAITGVILLVIASVVETVLRAEIGLPLGALLIPAAVVALFLVIRVPAARYSARGYQISRDRLRVVRGILWHSDTVVPLGRVQHIDVDQGPLERALGIATMTLHTAGSHNASVSLPGLGHDLAIAMREGIRAHIKRETM